MSISQDTIMQSSTKCFLFNPLFLVACFWLIAQAGGSVEHRQAKTAFVTPVGSFPQMEILFVMGADGNAEFLHLGGRSYKKLPSSIDQGSAQNERAEAPTDLALKEVQSAVEAFIKAFNNHDWEPFRNCFADDATVFFPSATMAAARANGRNEIEAIFKTLFDAARKRKDSPPYLNIEPKDMRIRVSGNAAVVTFHLGGKDSLGRRTIIFEKLKGKWLIVHLHASTMAI